MQDIPAEEATELGRDLRNGGFRPLPKVDAHGQLANHALRWLLDTGTNQIENRGES